MTTDKIQALRDALNFYAEQQHFVLHDADVFDTISGEPQNWQEDESNTIMFEDGSVAKEALAAYAALTADASEDAPDWQHIPVEYQYRTRPQWGADNGGWCDWQKCSPESWADYRKTPVLHDWEYETRELYLQPTTARPAPVGAEQAPRQIPDSECVQSKCACVTTGCWGECSMKRNPVVFATSKLTWPEVSAAANAANHSLGQWMPEQWIQAFVKAYNKE